MKRVTAMPRHQPYYYYGRFTQLKSHCVRQFSQNQMPRVPLLLIQLLTGTFLCNAESDFVLFAFALQIVSV